MAFSSLKPCSRLVRGSPHQTDQQLKEVYYLLQDHQEQQQEDVEAVEDPQTREHLIVASRKAPCVDDGPLPPAPSEPNSCQEELPTFIAHQGFPPLKLRQKKECKNMVDASHVATGWFQKEHSTNGELLYPYLEQDCFSQSCLHTSLPPPEVPRLRAHKFSFMRMDPKKQNTAEQDHHNKQRPRFRKINSCHASSNIYGITLERTISLREEMAGVEKRRNSSASVQDMLNFRQVVPNKGRCHEGRSSSWEEEVRQAMAKSLIGKKQDEEGHGLQRSTSVKECGSPTLPPTLLVKRTGGSNEFDSTAVCLGAGSKPNTEGDVHPSQKKNAVEKRLWRGFNVKSPSEERWEEAAEFEEQRELQRNRGRSLSMRYDTSRSAELMGQVGEGPWDTRSNGNVAYHDDEWAVYKKSGYVNMRPRNSGTFAAPACCSSLLGRSLSMRDTRMGLVMECAACGAALQGEGGRLLCFCSCCAAARASSMAQGPARVAMPTKKKGGFLRACRRLLGLGKKCSPHTQM